MTDDAGAVMLHTCRSNVSYEVICPIAIAKHGTDYTVSEKRGHSFFCITSINVDIVS